MVRTSIHLLASVGALLLAVGDPASAFGPPRQTNVSYWRCNDGEHDITLKITQIGNRIVGVAEPTNSYSGFRGLTGTGKPDSHLTLTLRMKRAMVYQLHRDCPTLPDLYDTADFKVESTRSGATPEFKGEWNEPVHDTKDDGMYDCVSHRTEAREFSLKLAQGGYSGGPPPPSAGPTPSPTPPDPLAPVKDLLDGFWKEVGKDLRNLGR